MSDLDLLTLGAICAPASPFDFPTAADVLADEARRDQALDRTLAALDSDDATLTDVRAVLCALGRSNADPVRTIGVCMRLAGALGRFDDCLDVPPSALNDVVRDSLVGCRNDLCAEKVAPWCDDHNGCCSADCETTWLGTVEP